MPGNTAAPGPATATVTWPTRSGEAPKTFVSSSRIGSPPTLVKMMSRIVWFSKPAAASVWGAATCGLALQLVTQPSPPDPCRAAAAGRESAKRAIVTARISSTAAPSSPSRIGRVAFRRPIRLAAIKVLSSLTRQRRQRLSRRTSTPGVMPHSARWQAATSHDRRRPPSRLPRPARDARARSPAIRYSSSSRRPMIIFWISAVPSPISSIGTSRYRRSISYSLEKP